MALLNVGLKVTALLCLGSILMSDAQTPAPDLVCPSIPEGTVGACVRACESDANCTGGLKCCSNGCGTSCVSGVPPPAADNDPPKIVWTEVFVSERRSRINTLPADPVEYLSNSTITTTYKYQLTDHNFLAIAGDYESRLIFFSDGIAKKIYVGNLMDEVGANVIYQGTSQTVEGIAVDWIAKNVYWCDAGYDWIMVANYSGLNARILIDTGLDKPRDLVVYPQKGTMYWTDWGVNVTSISVAALAGDGVRKLVVNNLHYPNGLTIDYATDTLFWVDANPAGSRLESVLLDGTSRRLIFTAGRGTAHFFDIATFKDYLFMTDWFGNLQSINRTSGDHLFSFALGTRPHSIMTYGPGLQPAYPTSPCVPNPCDQLCIHDTEPGEHKCICGHGYQLGENGTCIQEEGALIKPSVLLLSKTKLCHYPGNFADLSFTDGYEPPCLVRNRTHSVALAVDVGADWVFFSDFQWKRLYRVRLRSSSAVEQISGAIGSVEGMAVDYINLNLYWTDYKLSHIVVANYDGSHRVTLVNTNIVKPRSIVIHVETRKMFWTEFGPPYEIEQADLDGQNRRVLVTLTYSPSGLAYDYVTGRLVYGETGSGTIYMYDIASGVRTQLHSRNKLIPFYDMEIFGDYLIWTEWGASNGLHALNLETKAIHQSQIIGEPVYGVRVYADVEQQANGTSADCGEDNGGCSQLCVGTATSYRCYCSTGFLLGEDGRTCQTGGLVADKFALVTDSYEKAVFQVDLNSESHDFVGIAIPDLKNPIAIDYNPVDEKVYVSDVIGKKIVRANLNGSAVEVIASENIMIPDGIAIDYFTGLIYWTDAGLNMISVANLDGTHRLSLITEDLDQPRAIVLDPFEGVMFWSDWGTQPKIEKGSMDGGSRETIVSTDIAWTNGLTIDRTATRIYWCDAKTDRIETSFYDGTDRRVFLDEGIVHPFGIAVFEDFVYWTEWTRRGLMRANRTLPRNETTASLIGSESFLRLNGITIFSQDTILEGTTQCSTDNGGCGQLCLLSPQGRTCHCEDGSGLLEDGFYCHEKDNLCPMVVPNGEFPFHCDRHPGAQCSVVCDEGFNSSLANYTCLEGPEWNHPVDHICKVIECPFLQPTANSEVNECSAPHGYDSICSFRCRDGFSYYNGSNERRCRQDGTWSGEEMFCDVTTCPTLIPPANGMYQPQACMDGVVTRDAECRLFCSQGYQSRSIVVLCLPSGTWSIDLTRVECIDTAPPVFNVSCPSEPINFVAPEGQMTYAYRGTDLGAMDNSGEVKVTYNLPPEPTVSLMEGLHSFIQTATDPSGNAAVCDYVVNVTVNHCHYLPIPYNSNMREGCPTYHGTTCRFRCNDGFRLTGNETATCMKSPAGEFLWSSRSPHCEAVICPEPETVEGAIREGCALPYSPNHRCDFVCDRGYEEDGGSTSRTCEDSGQWSGTPLQCTRRKCISLGPLQNGIISPQECTTDGVYARETCNYSCDEGFQLEGSPTQVCSTGGTWLTNDAERTCKDVNGPHFNGTCPQDLTLVARAGQATAVANWTDPTVIDAGGQVLNITSTPQRGSLLSEGIHSVVIHALDDSNNRGSCFFTIEVKVIKCPLTSDAIPGGDCSPLLGLTCTFGCNGGHRLLGSASRTCEWDNVSAYGTWSGEDSSCEAITCPMLEVPEGAHMSGCNFDVDRVPYGSICTLTCQEGYGEFEGVEKKCSENGTWVGSDFTCSRVRCERLYTTDGMSVQPASCENGTEYLGTCTYSCPEGSSLVGNENRTCLANGQWNFDGQPPTCIKDEVEPPTDAPSSVRMDFVITEPCKEVVHISDIVHMVEVLAPDIELGAGVHETSLMYANDDVFRITQVRINVTVITCPPLTSDLLAGLTCSSTYGSEATFACPDDARLVGSSTNVCQDDGMITCPPLTSDLLAGLTCSSTYGSEATFACPEGERLVGSSISICQDDGSWSSEVPTCEEVVCPRPDIPGGFGLTGDCEQGGNNNNICLIECLLNRAVPPIALVCRMDGAWRDMDDRTEYNLRGLDVENCVDVTPPEITCPPDIQRDLPSTGDIVDVTWSLPNVTDNYDPSPSITIAPPPPPRSLTSGTYLKRYRAADSRGNIAECTFTIQIDDVTPPVSINCPNGTVIQPIDSILDLYTWEAVTFTDNVAVLETVPDRGPGTMVGSYEPMGVTYTARDEAGNVAQCTFTVMVVPRARGCKILDAPFNGGKTCDGPDWCTMTCNAGYTFLPPIPREVLYVCVQGTWQNGGRVEREPVIPQCGPLTRKNMRMDMASFRLESGTCSGNEDGMKEKFLEIFASSPFKALLAADSGVSSDVTNIQVECGDVTGDAGRGRRAAGGAQVNITYVVHGISNFTSFDTLDRGFNLSVTGFFGDANTLVLDDGSTAVLVPESSQQGLLMSNCVAGSQEFDLVCITCPAGTYFRMRTQACTRCPVGQYQNEPGQTKCKRCHSDHSTPGSGAPNSDDCKHQCQPGEYSYSGLGPCSLCPYGTYQTGTGSRGCSFCPPGSNTTRRGSTNPSACRGPRVPTTGVDVIVTTGMPTTTRAPPTLPNVPEATTNRVVVMTTSKVITTKENQKPDKKDETTTMKKPVKKTEPPKPDQQVQKSGGGGHWIWIVVISALVGLILLVIMIVYIKRRRQSAGHSRLFHSQEAYGEEMDDGLSELMPEVSGSVVAFQNPAFAEVDL